MGGIGGWTVRAAAVVVMLGAGFARADTRYYLLQARYDWTLKATQDSTSYEPADELPPIQTAPLTFCEPLDLTVVLKVDDLNTPGRKARVTYYFQSLGYTDELRQWTVNDFADRRAIHKLVSDFITQSRHLSSIPLTAAYEEEAIACLLLTAHGRSVVIDLDVTPDMPDPLVYQADALIHDAFIRDEALHAPTEHGVPWFDNDAQVRELREKVLASGVQRVERLRHMLWGHLKLLAMFVENHPYEYFNPRPLSGDAPVLLTVAPRAATAQGAAVNLNLVARRTNFSKVTPGYAFPALYRWASMPKEDFAAMIGQAVWRATGSADVTQTTSGRASGNRRAENAAERLELTRQSLSRPPRSYNRPQNLIDELAWRNGLGQRYIETLIRVHKSGDGEPAGPIAPGRSRGWVAELLLNEPNPQLRGQFMEVVEAAPEPRPSDDAATFGLWLTSLDDARFHVDQTLDRADVYRIHRRTMVAATTVKDAPLFVPGLASDDSPNRFAIVDVESKTMLEGRRLTAKEARAYLPKETEPTAVE